MADKGDGVDDDCATRRSSTRRPEAATGAGSGETGTKRLTIDSRDTTDGTHMEGVEDVSSIAGYDTGHPPGLSMQTTINIPIRPVAVQDPLHRAIAKNFQVAETEHNGQLDSQQKPPHSEQL